MKSYHTVLISKYPKLLNYDTFSLDKEGILYTVKAMFTGFAVNKAVIKIGPFKLRQYNKETDNRLGTWGGPCCIAELKFRDRTIKNHQQKTPFSMYIEPAWLMKSFHVALQLIINDWVGMHTLHYFNEKGEEVGILGTYRTQLTESYQTEIKPGINNIKKKELEKYMRAQCGKCGTAISRYSWASCEILEEGIVDFMMVLENLLAYKMDNTEITHRISTRGAFLLSKNPKERLDYYNALKYLYRLRSKIVHGEEVDSLSFPKKDKAKRAFLNLGVIPKASAFHDRFHLSNFTRETTYKALIFFINNEDKLNKDWLEKLELGLKSSKKR